MLNKFVKVAALVAMLTLVVPATNTEAATPRLSTKKITLVVGQSKKLTVKKTSKNVKWRVKKKKVASVKKLNKKSARVTAKKKGKTTVTAIVGGKKLVCRVVVKAKSNSTSNSSKEKTGNSTEINSETSGSESSNNIYVEQGRYTYTSGNIDISVLSDALVWEDWKTRLINNPGAHCFLMDDGNIAFIDYYVCWIEPNGKNVTLDVKNVVYIKGYDGNWYPNENYGTELNGIYLDCVDGMFSDDYLYKRCAPLYNEMHVTLKKLEEDGNGDLITEDTDDELVRQYFGFYMPFKKDDGSYIQADEVSYEITNNSRSDGKPVIACSLINRRTKTGDDLKKYGDTAQAYPSVGITPLRPGTCDLTVSAAGKSITIHFNVEEVVDDTFLNYTDVLQTMMDTPLGETTELTLEGDCVSTTTVTIDGVDTIYNNEKTITVDGVKGNSDVETLLNLGAWIVDNKSYRYGTEDDVDDTPHSSYFFFREWWFGADCGGLNTILEDAATLLGYTAWQYNSSGHAITAMVLNGQKWSFDAGRGGTAGLSFSGGSATYHNDSNGSEGPAITITYSGTASNRKWEVYYWNIDDSDNFNYIATETVTALADLTIPLPWYGD